MCKRKVLLSVNDFDIGDWVAEGPVELTRDDHGALVIRSLTAGSTIWYKPMVFENNIQIDWVATTIEPKGKNNLNFIFHAIDGSSSVIAKSSMRTGEYAQYHQFENYIVTFVGDGAGGHSRIRRNPGFEVLSEALNEVAQFGQTYKFSLISWDGRLQFFIDGRLVHDIVDPRPYTRGAIGFRTWRTNMRIECLSVYDISGEGTPYEHPSL